MNYVTSKVFKSTGKGAIAKQVFGGNPTSDDTDRTVKFVVSSPLPDRDNDVVIQDGIDFSDYMKNPVFLFGHDTGTLPIGKCIDLSLNGEGNLTATFQMVPADMPCVGDKAEAVFRMCKEGFLFATSIGFLPVEWERSDRDGGYDFNKISILEISCVPVPANPEALIIEDNRDAFDQGEQGKTQTSINNKNGAEHRKRVWELYSRLV